MTTSRTNKLPRTAMKASGLNCIAELRVIHARTVPGIVLNRHLLIVGEHAASDLASRVAEAGRNNITHTSTTGSSTEETVGHIRRVYNDRLKRPSPFSAFFIDGFPNVDRPAAGRRMRSLVIERLICLVIAVTS
jgi:hypothetical protein